jgi:lysophospholipase
MGQVPMAGVPLQNPMAALPHDKQFIKLLADMGPYVSTEDMDGFLHKLTHDSEGELAAFDEQAMKSGRRQLTAFPDGWMDGSTEKIAKETTSGWINTQSWRTFDSAIARPDGGTVKLHYVTVEGPGTRGGVIVSVGHGEPAEKYAEQLHNLREAGFSPIYALDHRGQGRSSRLLDDTFKSHVQASDDFIRDFRAFVGLADAEMTTLSKGAGKRFLHCHSMGCAIGFTYLLEEYYAQRPNIFNAVAANAPLVKPVTSPFPYSVAVLVGATMDALGLGESYPPTKGKSFEELYAYDATRPVRLNLHYQHNCHGNRNTEYLAGHTGLCLGDVTGNFAKEFFGMYTTFEDFTRGRLSIPILIQQAKNNDDGSDGIVINAPQETFCSRADGCKVTKYPNANHNIWFETDGIRNSALQEAFEFYDSKANVGPAVQNKLPDMCSGWKWWCAWENCDCIWSCSHAAANGRC